MLVCDCCGKSEPPAVGEPKPPTVKNYEVRGMPPVTTLACFDLCDPCRDSLNAAVTKGVAEWKAGCDEKQAADKMAKAEALVASKPKG